MAHSGASPAGPIWPLNLPLLKGFGRQKCLGPRTCIGESVVFRTGLNAAPATSHGKTATSGAMASVQIEGVSKVEEESARRLLAQWTELVQALSGPVRSVFRISATALTKSSMAACLNADRLLYSPLLLVCVHRHGGGEFAQVVHSLFRLVRTKHRRSLLT